MTDQSSVSSFKRIIAIFHVLIILAALLGALVTPIAANAQDNGETVRVGLHKVPFYIIDRHGKWSGYAYDYQCKISAYTGWDYSYVEGSWSELLQMLSDGEIDMLCDVSYTEERAEKFLYSSMPMGTESYHIFVSPDNDSITAEDYTSLNGKKIGVKKDSYQKGVFINWAKAHGVEADLVEMNCSDEESVLKLGKELDAYVGVDLYGDPKAAVPINKIGSSDFYFAVSKSRPELLAELDAAMNRIQDENKYFNSQLNDKYLRNTNASRYLTNREQCWLSEHGAIRVGYQDNYLAFCARDKSTGELTGALRDYLDNASTVLENAELELTAVAYPTVADAMEAMRNGEVDCVFPANLTNYESELLEVAITSPIMRSEMDAVVRAADQKEFLHKKDVVVAVNEGNTNYDAFLDNHYPGWKRVYFADTPTGLAAVAAGKADCVIISNYRYNNVARQCEKLHLATVYTGVDEDYCIAIQKGDTVLYSILARVINAVPDAAVHKALTYYSTEEVKVSFAELLKDNLLLVMVGIAIVLLVFLILLLRSIRAERRVREEQHIVKDLNKRVFVDALTSVRNKGAYNEYIQDLQNQLEDDQGIAFAIGVFDCDNLKKINDCFGHGKGDLYLKAACGLICQVFRHSPVFRIGGDEFVVVLRNEDYENREELISLFEERQRAACESAEHEWDEVHISMGVAVFDPVIDQSVHDTVHRADEIMYENKRRRKEGKART
ncbi:MAG: transporter substrate-binding domain-containing protein [Lachnospiraceae bacterium]|nr:transporter substrate-binding domain-containing protein [Lachnospiraceae bacterium]